MSRSRLRRTAWLLLGLLVALASCKSKKTELATTVADLQVVHMAVSVADAPAHGLVRVPDRAVVQTTDQGRARLRLDDGTWFVVPGTTKVNVEMGRATLDSGKLFALGAPGVRTEVGLGKATVLLTGANAAIARPANAPTTARVYVASGELTVRVGDRDTTVKTGEVAVVSDAQVSVEPERAFEDWTGGLAVPWGAEGKPVRAVGELWGRPTTAAVGEIGSPLTIRAQAVSARIVGESAETEVRTTFFHAGSQPVVGDFRMALPAGALVSGFAAGLGDSLSEGRVVLGARDNATTHNDSATLLEWAGDGWVRGRIPLIQPGAVVTIVVRYAQWLSPRPTADGSSSIVQYRFPLVGDGAPPIIGEFSARLDASAANPKAIAAGLGAHVSGQLVELRRSDFRPTADLVVELALQPSLPAARMYRASPEQADESGPYVLVRAQAPAAKTEDGVSLVVLLDTTWSIEPEMLDAERALVEALVNMLGPSDQLLVLAADQSTRPVGPAASGPVDAARRQAVLEALRTLSPAGATDLGRALELAADGLDPKRPDSMIVYVGDGWPTVGDVSASEIRARLARRAGGMPRLGAVAVGPLSSRVNLTALVRGLGPLFELADRPSAAATAADLMVKALQPTVAGVELVLGSDVDQIYPLQPRAVEAGAAVLAIGRLRGTPPREVKLRWRGADGQHEERLAVSDATAATSADLGRRWAESRVEELALRSAGREAIADVALRSQLLTPWTAWVVGGSPSEPYTPTPLESRVLDLSMGTDQVFAAMLATPTIPGSALLDFSQGTDQSAEDNDDALKAAVVAAARRVLDDAIEPVRACRDSRAAMRPDLAGAVQVRFNLDGGGRPSKVKIDGDKESYDEALYQCLAAVVSGLRFPASGLKADVEVTHSLALPAPRPMQRTKCSATSTLFMPLRRGVWLERLRTAKPQEMFVEAKRACELESWASERALLEIILTGVWGADRVTLARLLDQAGERDAAAFLRREALRRARGADELRSVRLALLRDEGYPIGTFDKQLDDSKTDEGRLAVVERFLTLAPHDVRLRRLDLLLLEALGRKEALASEITAIRQDVFADASLLAACGSVLRRTGDETGARRAFGEIVERAPIDPWARAFAGDKLADEGWFDDATAVYARLQRMLGSEPLVLLRIALAHAGAGRIDLAGRILASVTQTEGRDGLGQVSELAADLAALLLTGSLGAPAAAAKAELERRILELPRKARSISVIVRVPAAGAPLDVRLRRGPDKAREERLPSPALPELGTYRLVLDPNDTRATPGWVLRITAPKEPRPIKGVHARIETLTWKGPADLPEVAVHEVALPTTGKAVDLTWSAGNWK